MLAGKAELAKIAPGEIAVSAVVTALTMPANCRGAYCYSHIELQIDELLQGLAPLNKNIFVVFLSNCAVFTELGDNGAKLLERRVYLLRKLTNEEKQEEAQANFVPSLHQLLLRSDAELYVPVTISDIEDRLSDHATAKPVPAK